MQDKLYKIPLEKPYKRREHGEDDIHFDSSTVEATVVGSSEDDMALEPNERFDTYFSEYGEILSPTKMDKYPNTDVLNGKDLS